MTANTDARPTIRRRREAFAVLLMLVLGMLVLSPTQAKALSPTFGYLDIVQGPMAPGVLRVVGWAATSDFPTTALGIRVLIDGAVDDRYYMLANTFRPDVGAAYPGYGNNHGFDFTIAVPTNDAGTAGGHTICAEAQNSGVYNQLTNCYFYNLSLSPFFGARFDHPHGSLLRADYHNFDSYGAEIDSAMANWQNTPTPILASPVNNGTQKLNFFTLMNGPPGAAGETTWNPGKNVGTTIVTATIFLYSVEMNKLTFDQRKGVAGHEAGHAFGLTHAAGLAAVDHAPRAGI